MEKTATHKRFTLSLPEKVHAELTKIANDKGVSSKEIIIKSLKLGMIALETESDPTKELIIRENVGTELERDTRLLFL